MILNITMRCISKINHASKNPDCLKAKKNGREYEAIQTSRSIQTNKADTKDPNREAPDPKRVDTNQVTIEYLPS